MNRRTALALSCTVFLTGCATSELATAPQNPDRPWAPTTSASGAIIPSDQGEIHPRHGLVLPEGFTLPSNKDVLQHAQSPELIARQDHPYSLAELIDVAQSRNPETRRAWNTARDAALAVGIAKSIYLPQLTATVVGGYTHSHSSDSNASISAGGPISALINDGLGNLDHYTRNNGGGGSGSGEVQTLGMQWLLFDFGKREASIEAVKQMQVASNILFTAAHQKIIYGVTTAFYMHAAAETRLRLLKEALANARHVQAAAEARLKQEQGTIVDVTQARQITSQDELRVVQAEGEDQNTRLALMTAMGVSSQSDVATLDVSGRPLSPDDGRLTDEMVRTAVSRRPDVLAAYAAARAADSRVSAAKSEFLPKVFVSGNVAYTTGRLALSSVPGIGNDSNPTLNLSSNRFSSLILGGISVPVFDGGMRAAFLKQAENQSDSANATLQQTVNEAVRQVVVAENAVHTSLSAYTASTRLKTAAQTSFNAAFTAYRSGVGSITQATIAQNGLLDATISQSDAYFAALIAATSLAFSTGSLGGAPASGSGD
ncbi:MAG: TolC family protein [Acetobacter aceti]|uniref:Transporter n=1 Tax=Acetobacter aceti TaxID=435 RepID=A0A1U9KFP8_ACEAC|nr:TolC family protein [Acetobacter aceti]AQS84631.1 transporter [Acetobacter aceti]